MRVTYRTPPQNFGFRMKEIHSRVMPMEAFEGHLAVNLSEHITCSAGHTPNFSHIAGRAWF